MTALPPDLEYGYVIGRFVRAGADSPDPDRLPDAVPVSGQVTFSPKSVMHRSTTGTAVTVLKFPIICTLDDEGFLVDSQGQIGVWLITGEYNVNYKLDQASLADHSITVLSTHNELTPLDLTLAAIGAT